MAEKLVEVEARVAGHDNEQEALNAQFNEVNDQAEAEKEELRG